MSNINFNNGMFSSNNVNAGDNNNSKNRKTKTDLSARGDLFFRMNNNDLLKTRASGLMYCYKQPGVEDRVEIYNSPVYSNAISIDKVAFRHGRGDVVLPDFSKKPSAFIQKLANVCYGYEIDPEKFNFFITSDIQQGDETEFSFEYTGGYNHQPFTAGTVKYEKNGSMVITCDNGEKFEVKNDSKKNETIVIKYNKEGKPEYASRYNKDGEKCAEFDYDDEGNISSGARINKEKNEITRYEYKNGILESYSKENRQDKDAITTTYYDKNNKKLKETYDTRKSEGARAYVLTTEYDSDGSVVSKTTKWDRPDLNKDVAKQVVTYVPSEDGSGTKEVTKYYDFKDREITINYNEQTKQTSYTCIDKNGETLYEKKYNEKGNQIAQYMYKNGKLDTADILDIYGNIKHYRYDENGNLIM